MSWEIDIPQRERERERKSFEGFFFPTLLPDCSSPLPLCLLKPLSHSLSLSISAPLCIRPLLDSFSPVYTHEHLLTHARIHTGGKSAFRIIPATKVRQTTNAYAHFTSTQVLENQILPKQHHTITRPKRKDGQGEQRHYPRADALPARLHGVLDCSDRQRTSRIQHALFPPPSFHSLPSMPDPSPPLDALKRKKSHAGTGGRNGRSLAEEEERCILLTLF